MKILETRNRKGIKWRRYCGQDGERITSLEIPEDVVKRVIRKKDLVQAMREYESSKEILKWKKLRNVDESI